MSEAGFTTRCGRYVCCVIHLGYLADHRPRLSKVPPQSANSLEDQRNWTEALELIRLSLTVGPQTTGTGVSYVYVPEVLHLVSVVAG